jgi:hypothetical protein
MNTRPYYTLVINEGALNGEPRSHWTPQWGSFKKSEVVAERTISWSRVPKKHWQIIETAEGQDAINAKVLELNA